jgi:hypothetical protein
MNAHGIKVHFKSLEALEKKLNYEIINMNTRYNNETEQRFMKATETNSLVNSTKFEVDDFSFSFPDENTMIIHHKNETASLPVKIQV